MNLYILDVCIPDGASWQTPRVFGEDVPAEMREMDAAIKEAKERDTQLRPSLFTEWP
jgi:hypothetical protein